MHWTHWALAAIAGIGFVGIAKAADSAPFPKFRAEEIDKSLSIGYGVVLADVNKDGKPDIIVADKERVIWLENPTWKLHTILAGKTKVDNVCLDPMDIDGDGKLDLALGAGWKPSDTQNPGTLQWLRQGDDPDKEWDLYPINNQEPTVHRIRWADVDGDGKKELVSVPLQGRGATQGKNYSESGVRVLAFSIPKDPKSPDWPSTLISDSLPVMHNFQWVDLDGDGKLDMLSASYEGVHFHKREAGGKWTKAKLGEGDQSKPNTNRGSSEIKLGKLKGGKRFIATIEPWHGNQVVVYVQADDGKWNRQVIDNALAWGHAVWTADLDGDGADELIIGVRDPLPAGKAKQGVRLYKPTSDAASEWQKDEIDPGGVNVEDLAAADLNGDGKIDIVAVGRQSKNVKVYWNQGK